jgi:hypothetical protein
MFQVVALLAKSELLGSAKRKGHFAPYNCLVLRHTKHSGIQGVYCNPFLAKLFHGSHCMDLVMIRPLFTAQIEFGQIGLLARGRVSE